MIAILIDAFMPVFLRVLGCSPDPRYGRLPRKERLMNGYFSPEVIRLNVMHSISPQLDRCDELLDYYTEGLPREVWEPIAFKVATDHYGTRPFRAIAGSFRDLIEQINQTVRKLAQVTRYPAFHQENFTSIT